MSPTHHKCTPVQTDKENRPTISRRQIHLHTGHQFYLVLGRFVVAERGGP